MYFQYFNYLILVFIKTEHLLRYPKSISLLLPSDGLTLAMVFCDQSCFFVSNVLKIV